MNVSNVKHYKLSEFAKLLNVSTVTLQRWDRTGVLKAHRTITNRRYYTYDQYLECCRKRPQDSRKTIIYARVSTRNQKDDLNSQVSFLKQFCNGRGMIVDEVITDFGSGLNYNRKKWNALLDGVISNQVKTIVVAHKDRFIRFGFDWFQNFCLKFNAEILVVNNEEMSPQQELVQDIVSILHVFSCRLYGLRKYKKLLEGDESLVKEPENRD